MFCPNCGAQNENEATFCKNCGAKLAASQGEPQAQPAEAFTPNAAQPQPANSYTNYAPYQAPVPENPVIGTVKRVAASPVFLTAVILFTVSLVMEIISSFAPSNALVSFLYDFARENGFGYEMRQFLNEYDFLLEQDVAGILFSSAPTIVMAVGLWLIYAAAKKPNASGMSSAGLTVAKVMTIISLVLISIVTALFAIAFLGVSVGLNYADGIPDFAFGIVYGIMFVVAVAFVLYIVYLAKIIQSLNTVKNTVNSGIASDKVSGFVGVMCYIVGVITALNSISGLLFSVPTFLSSLCSGVATVLFGVVLFRYRNAMRAFARPANFYGMNYSQPYTPGNPAAPQANPAMQAQTVVCQRCGHTYGADQPACPVCGQPK